MSLKVICPTCKGNGKVPKLWFRRNCPDCRGSGKVMEFSSNFLHR